MADYNLEKAVCELDIYIGATETKYVEYLRSNNIDWDDTSNEYVIALEKLYDIKNNAYKVETWDDIQKVRATVDELREMIDNPEKVMEHFNALEIKVIDEIADSIYGTVTKYVLKNDRQEDEQDPLNVLRHMIFKLKESLTERDYTMDELKQIKAKFEFAREYIDKVIN